MIIILVQLISVILPGDVGMILMYAPKKILVLLSIVALSKVVSMKRFLVMIVMLVLPILVILLVPEKILVNIPQ